MIDYRHFFDWVCVLILEFPKFIFGVQAVDVNLFVIVLSVLYVFLFCYFSGYVILYIVMYPKIVFEDERPFPFCILAILVAISVIAYIERMFS